MIDNDEFQSYLMAKRGRPRVSLFLRCADPKFAPIVGLARQKADSGESPQDQHFGIAEVYAALGYDALPSLKARNAISQRMRSLKGARILRGRNGKFRLHETFILRFTRSLIQDSISIGDAKTMPYLFFLDPEDHAIVAGALLKLRTRDVGNSKRLQNDPVLRQLGQDFAIAVSKRLQDAFSGPAGVMPLGIVFAIGSANLV